MSLVSKLQKRRSYPVELGTGETIHVRPLTIGETDELVAVEQVNGLLAMGFAFGCCLLNDDGSPAFPREAGESPAAFAKRVQDAIASVPQDTLGEIQRGVEKASRVPKPETIAKN